MQPSQLLLLCSLAALAGSVEVRSVAPVTPVTPVEKVIQLLTDLKTEVETEGTNEASTYDQFACFCKTMTGTKSTSITSGKDSIDSLSADIEQKTALKESKATELRERQADHETLSTNLAETTEQCEKDKAEYEATDADLSKAIRGLTNAIQALEDAKPSSFLALKRSVASSLDLAEVLHLGAAKRRRDVAAFLQQSASVDPLDPTYKYHSHGIIETLNTLKTEFTDKKSDVDAEWQKTDTACTNTKGSLNNQIIANNGAMNTLDTDITSLKGEIAGHRTDLVNKEALLKDDQAYLKDLTERCEVRAKDWDQRSQMRADELEALTGALTVLTNNVSAVDASVNLRALLQRKQNSIARNATARSNQSAGSHANASAPPSFLQGYAVKVRSHGFLARAETGSSLQARQEVVAATLREAGQRLKSTPLALLASRVAADPFEKVKTLIQQLVERLLAEATAEASKKGFCDEELGKARKDREHRFEETQQLSVVLSGLESKFDELEAEISLLSGEVTVLTYALGNATADRAAEKAVNQQIVLDATGGLEAVKQAITILKVFYKRAGKATVLLQASPVDEDTDGAGFKGAYQGKQAASKGIIGMLEVIQTDFERTIRVTETMEKMAEEDFVEFDRASKADISGKETKIQLDTEDLATTNTTMNQKMDDLKTAMNLLDGALRVLEDLKPTCIDTGMSYADRVAKREEEIQALKTALCQLDPEDVEPSCP